MCVCHVVLCDSFGSDSSCVAVSVLASVCVFVSICWFSLLI